MKITLNNVKKKLIKNHKWEILNWFYPAIWDKLIKDTIKVVKDELEK